jgi:hypothetical protein
LGILFVVKIKPVIDMNPLAEEPDFDVIKAYLSGYSNRILVIFVSLQRPGCSIAPFLKKEGGGKSGQQRAQHFLTGRGLFFNRSRKVPQKGKLPMSSMGRQAMVKRWGKSPPVPGVTPEAW